MRRLALCALMTMTACSGSGESTPDASSTDGAVAADAGDSPDIGGAADAGPADTGASDSGNAADMGGAGDTGPVDVGPTDLGSTDSGVAMNAIDWSFGNAWRITADHFEMTLDGERFVAPAASLSFNSNPNEGPSFSLVMEIEWAEGSLADQRLYIYFDSDGINYQADEVRSYGIDGEWIYFDNPVPLFGSELGTDYRSAELRLTVAGRGEILFRNVVIRPEALCPTCMWN